MTITTTGGTKLLLTAIEAAEKLTVSRTKVYELMSQEVFAPSGLAACGESPWMR